MNSKEYRNPVTKIPTLTALVQKDSGSIFYPPIISVIVKLFANASKLDESQI